MLAMLRREASLVDVISLISQRTSSATAGKTISRNTVGDISLSTQSLRNTGSVVASRNLDVTASQTLDNSGATLSGLSALNIRLDGTLVNLGGLISIEGTLAVSATGLHTHRPQAIHEFGLPSVQDWL
jgi:filamentous hemagglutinin